MFFVKLFYNIRSEKVTDTSIVVGPPLDFIVGIRPKQVTQESGVRHFLRSELLVNNVQVIQVWTQPSVHSQNSVVDDCSNWEHVKAKSKFLPQLDVISSFALVVKPIHSID